MRNRVLLLALTSMMMSLCVSVYAQTDDYLYYIDGKKVDGYVSIQSMFPQIRSFFYITEKAAVDLYGPEAVNGVCFIQTYDGTIIDSELKRPVVSSNNNVTHEYVDLGLSVKWATCNVGADKPEDNGGLYGWGETEPRDIYAPRGWMSNKWGVSLFGFTKYNRLSDLGPVDNKETLDPEDDVAHVLWGGKWRMPSEQEMHELHENCNWEWTTLNGVYGYRVTSKKRGYNDRSIFLPAAGKYVSALYTYGSDGNYWSSSLMPSNVGPDYVVKDGSCCIHFTGYYVRVNYDARECAYSVRPVCE